MREGAQARILAVTGAIALGGFCLAPFAYMLWIAFARGAEPGSAASGFTLDHFREALDPALHMTGYLRNTLVTASAAAVLAPAAAVLAAYPLARLPLSGRRGVLLAALALSMFPPVSLAGALFRLLAGLGWINTPAALILPYAAWLLPLCLWFLSGYLAGLPRDLDRAARVDGCGTFGVFARVLLPLSRPGLASAALVAFLFACNEFLFALLFTVDAHARTLPVGIALFQGLHGELPWGALMAAAALAGLPAAAIALLFQRHVVQGLTRGAVKG
jgi:multiple sugar transport system permease protein